MAQKNTLVKSKEWMAREDVAAFLQELGAKLAEDEVTIHQGGREVELSIPDRVKFKVKVKEKTKKGKTKHTLSLKLKWRDGDTPAGSISLG